VHDEAAAVARARIDRNSGKRVYLRIFRVLRDMIISGELTVGTQIPSGATRKREWGRTG
jgi:DNA-binding transcriptional regulator YhcF (GntR family)